MSDTLRPEPAPAAICLDWRTYAVVAVVALAIGVVNALSIAHDHARGGGAYALGEPLFWELTSVGVIALLAPAVAAGVTRLRSAWRDRRWLAAVVLVALVVVGFSALHVVGMVALRYGGAALYGMSYHFDWSPAELAYEFRKDLATCVLLGLTFWLALSRREITQARGGSVHRGKSRKRPRTISGCATARPPSASHRATWSGSRPPATTSSIG